MSIEISTFSARRRDGHVGHIGVPLKFTRLHEEIVQMTLCKYGGRPHWALATNRLFLSACPVRDMYGEGKQFSIDAEHVLYQRHHGSSRASIIA